MYDDYPTVIESKVENNMIYLIILGIIFIGVLVFSLISLAKVFKKANRSGISAIIPIYNNHTFCTLYRKKQLHKLLQEAFPKSQLLYS